SAPDIEETHYGSGAVVISGTGIFSITTPSSITTTDLQFASDILAQSAESVNAFQSREPAFTPGDTGGPTPAYFWHYLTSTSPQTNPANVAAFPQPVIYGSSIYLIDPTTPTPTNPTSATPTAYQFYLDPRYPGATSINASGNDVAMNYAPASSTATWTGSTAPANAWQPTMTPPSNTPYPVSAPVIRPMSDGQATLYTEDPSGNLFGLNLNPGTTTSSIVNQLSATTRSYQYPSSSSGTVPPAVPPAPYLFEDWLLASRPGGVNTGPTSPSADLYIYKFAPNDGINNSPSGGSATGTSITNNQSYLGGLGADYYPSPLSTIDEMSTGSPVAGIVHEDCNNIIAGYPTDRGFYTIFLGARGERITPSNNAPGAGSLVQNTYVTKLATMRAGQAKISTDGVADVYSVSSGKKVLAGQGTMSTGYVEPGQLALQVLSNPAGSLPTNSQDGLFADYDADIAASEFQTFSSSTPITAVLDRLFVGFGNSLYAQPMSPGTTVSQVYHSYVSSPVMDSQGDFCYTDNFVTPSSANGVGLDSSVMCVHDSYQSTNNRIVWRFRLPTVNDTTAADADGNSFPTGFYFVGPPVLDGSGKVYVAATNYLNPTVSLSASTTPTTMIFCFDTSSPIYSTFSGVTGSLAVTQPAINLQHDEYGLAPSQMTQNNTNGQAGNYTLVQSGTGDTANTNPQGTIVNNTITFTNFGMPSSQTIPELFPMWSEPGGFYVVSSQTAGAQFFLQTHTNVSWYTDFQTAPSGTNKPEMIYGLAVSGDYLYFTDIATNHLYRLYTRLLPADHPHGRPNLATATTPSGKPVLQDLGVIAPGPLANQTIGQIAISPAAIQTYAPASLAAPTSTELEPYETLGRVSPNGPITINNGVVAVSANAAIITPTNGNPAFTAGAGVAVYDPLTALVTDSGGLTGFDFDGDALFHVTSTRSTNAGTGRVVTAPLSHPSAVTQLGRDNFLLADSGNNRCVEVDREGNVLWEVSQLVDPNNYTVTGDPLTLSNPTSIQVWRDVNNGLHYLITDQGHNRIVDVTDTSNGHQIDWIFPPKELTASSQVATGPDTLRGRGYQFSSAIVYQWHAGKTVTSAGPYTPKAGIAVLCTNKSVAPLVSPGVLQPAQDDLNGSSILLLTAPMDAVGPMVNGIIPPSTTMPSSTVVQVIPQVTLVGGALETLRNAEYLSSYQPEPGMLLTATPAYDGREELLYTDVAPTGTPWQTVPLPHPPVLDLDPAWNLTFNATTSTTSPAVQEFIPSFSTVSTSTAVAPPATATANWQMLQSDYDALTASISAGYSSYVRSNESTPQFYVPLVPSSVQRISTGEIPGGAYYGDYLITNSYSVGSSLPPVFGGEAFVVRGYLTGPTATAVESVYNRTFSHPSIGAALNQPNCAVLAQ
ncbi:MAG: hypothetical protein ACLQVD_16145, partial [Capsulimonadaceae bacterium]